MRKQLDFTYDEEAFKGLPKFIDELRNKDIRFIIILVNYIFTQEQKNHIK